MEPMPMMFLHQIFVRVSPEFIPNDPKKSEPRPAANKSIPMQSPQVAAPMERPDNPGTL